ncbi:hypothetical protein [Streptomyces hebeiensis]
MRISDYDDINHTEAARVLGISLVAALRGGELTTRQMRKLDRIAEKATKREDAKRAEKTAKRGK